MKIVETNSALNPWSAYSSSCYEILYLKGNSSSNAQIMVL